MEAENEEGAEEEGGRGGGEQPEEHERNSGDGEKRPARVGRTFGLGMGKGLKGESAGKGCREANALNAVGLAGLESMMCA